MDYIMKARSTAPFNVEKPPRPDSFDLANMRD
jgi:hypothetical protein